jgi:hypothetical protein
MVVASVTDALVSPYADFELKDSDGTGPNVDMKNPSDGLNAMKEYRGYILEGGPDVPLHLHKRLSLARKELLVECSEMGGITTGGNQITVNGNIEVNTEVQSYDLDGLMTRVSDFYRRVQTGGVIDLYWARDTFDDTTRTFTFSDGQSYHAYKRDGTFELKIPAIGGNPQTTIAKEGWLTLADNVWLDSVRPQDWENLYGGVATKSVPSGLGTSSRNSRCEDFVKLMVLGRRGFVDGNGKWKETFINGDGSGTAGTFNRKNAKGPMEEVSFLFVNSIAEYKTYSTPDLFLDELAYATAHEIAHLILLGGGGLDEDGHRMGPPDSLMGAGKQLSPLIFHEDEIRNINLPGRSSVLP